MMNKSASHQSLPHIFLHHRYIKNILALFENTVLGCYVCLLYFLMLVCQPTCPLSSYFVSYIEMVCARSSLLTPLTVDKASNCILLSAQAA